MASRTQTIDLINECWSYFKTTEPNPKSFEVWVGELVGLDLLNSSEFILHKFKQLEKWPANFPGTIKSLYFSWMRSKPKEYKELGCPKCLQGLLFGIKDSYSYVFNCGHCQSSDRAYPEATRYWLEANGYAIDWQHDYEGGIDKKFLSKFKQTFGKTKATEIPF